MEAQDPLSELADIHLPGALSFWPPALGWWLLAIVILVLIVFAIRAFLLRVVRLKKLSFAINELEQAYQSFTEQEVFDTTRNQAGLTFLNEVNAILRRVALLQFPNNPTIAKLNGSAWLAFLDQSDNSQEFSMGAGKALAEGIYQRHFKADAHALYSLACLWVEKRYKEQSNKLEKTNAANTVDTKGITA